jgi:exodeoxyribonuclease VII small subunit
MPRANRSRPPSPDIDVPTDAPTNAPTDTPSDDPTDDPTDGGASDLSYRQAQTALDLTLAELQTSDLDVEAMASLYQRAQAYADRCEALLRQVEQEVMQWDPQHPDQPPGPLQP